MAILSRTTSATSGTPARPGSQSILISSDGLLYANTRFGDFPHYLPTRKWESKDELFAGWMLLSYRKHCASSSVRNPYSAANVTDENPRTFWLANSNKAGEWLMIDLERT